MHIKIQGFKSYRDETVVDPFSPGLNLLVGRNGSGKSNFFSAVRFVLSDSHTSLNREERQALLHDGSTGGGGGATMSAYVEIEFDNTDGRFPTNKPTLLLRRTIGLKKDEYQLDRKSTSKGEVMSILESAGFSRSNPYYIVPQGRITHLTNQKDSDRLLLLKEVAGTKVYEERRAESTKIMDETAARREKITDTLETIDNRLSELEAEKEELKQYQVQDRAKRSIEYALYQRELKEVGDGLETIEEERRRDVDTANTRRSEYNDRQKDLAKLKETLASHHQRLEMLVMDQKTESEGRRNATKRKAEVECSITDQEEEGKKSINQLSRLEKDLEKVKADILKQEADLMEAVPNWEDALSKESSAKERLEADETTLRVLFDKQGRTTQFKSQKERDAHLKKEIQDRTEYLKMREKRVVDMGTEIESTKKELEETQAKSMSVRKEMEERKETMQALQNEVRQLKVDDDAAKDKRKDLWKVEAKVIANLQHTVQAKKDAEHKMMHTMDRETAKGLRAVAEIANRLKLDGYFGPLYDLFTVEDRYKTAVEVTAGTSLFQIVVDTDDTATKILDVLLKEKSGRVTFMPLNRLKHQEVEYPTGKDAVPMIKKIDFDPKFALAFEQVFAKTIICQTLEIAGGYTRTHGLNSITLEGDKYDRKGSLTGGYHDLGRSRLDAIKDAKKAQARHEQEAKEAAEAREAIERLDQQITQLLGKVQIAEAKRERLIGDRDPLVASLMSTQTETESLTARIARNEQLRAELQQAIRTVKTEIAGYEAELKTKMEQSLSSAELAQITQLNTDIDAVKKSLVDLSKATSECAARKSLLESKLSENLRPTRDALQIKIDTFEETGPTETSGESAASLKKELKKQQKLITDHSSKLEEIDAEVESLNSQVASLEKDREAKEAQQADDSRNIAKQQKNVDRYLAKRSALNERKDACNAKIRELGALPEEAFVETTASAEKLLKKLRKVNESLKGFPNVNKKAYEQYMSFTKQRDELLARQEELDQSSESITELIEVLDNRKDEAIERTFKQVAKNFEQVFEKLVPAGRGRLIMQKREADPAEDDMDVDDEPREGAGVESYTGVAIRVSFNSKSNEGLKIQQLSGGQKALVALAMIFSIQKCDPAPFYLFDEIDANLDADRRTGVAAMIKELAETGQYICTTFRPELIAHANSFFGVVFNATKISKVSAITAEQCHSFIDATENQR